MIDDICANCDCSKVTARRDLRRLADEGSVERIYGGAVCTDNGTSSSVGFPRGKNAVKTQTALVDRVDALIVSPNETVAADLVVDRAMRAGIPVVAESARLDDATTVVAINDYAAGIELGRWVGSYAREHLHADIVVLDVTYNLPGTQTRSRGFAEGLRQLITDVSIISVNGRAQQEYARHITADALTVHPEVNVIFGINDDSALGALDAYHTSGLDEEELLVVSFGLEGVRTKQLLLGESPYKAGVAMFPEVVGRACINAAVCAHHGCALPDRIFTPFAVVTGDTIGRFYMLAPETDEWILNLEHAQELPSGSTAFSLLNTCHGPSRPNRIGYIEIFSSHEWYQNVQRTMEEYAAALGISLEIVDASHTIAYELEALKQAIGIAAAGQVRAGETIILDAGITTTYLARALRGREGITVITNSLAVLTELRSEPNITLIATGGVLRSKNNALVGPDAEVTFEELRADKAFITGAGVSIEFGLSKTTITDARLTRAMIDAARHVVLLIDHTKIGVESLVKVAPIEGVHTIITDDNVSANHRLRLVQNSIDVLTATVEGSS